MIKSIRIWLFSTLFLVWCMVLLGGATRLTHSGLSITEWKPLVGAIPPLTEFDWFQEFEKYKLTPEFKFVNSDIILNDFKFIYLMEYFHRLLGRLLGLVFFIPLLFFWKNLDIKLKRLSLCILILGAFQGAMGWYMVKSGLKDNPFVSPYRLTAHLFLALIIMGVLSYALSFKLKCINTPKIRLLYISVGLVAITIFYGALVAGHKAGLIYNTFPFMNGEVIPSEFLDLTPWWQNFFSNHAAIQWIHRFLAIATFIHILIFHIKTRKQETTVWLFLVCVQFILGILTLIYHVPVFFGVLHQGIGALLFTWSVYMVSRFKNV